MALQIKVRRCGFQDFILKKAKTKQKAKRENLSLETFAGMMYNDLKAVTEIVSQIRTIQRTGGAESPVQSGFDRNWLLSRISKKQAELAQ